MLTETLYGLPSAQLREHDYRPEEQRGDLLAAYHAMNDDITDPNHKFGESDIFKYHTLLAQNSPQMQGEDPNEYSQKGREITNMPWIVRSFPNPEDIPQLMKGFAKRYGEYMRFQPQGPADTITVIENATLTKVELTDIHPFPDGNGRLGRLLADSVLLQGGLSQMPRWLDPRLDGDPFRQKLNYFLMMRLASEGYNALLVKFITEQQIRAIKDEFNAIHSSSQALVQSIESGLLDQRKAELEILGTYRLAVAEFIIKNPMPQLPKNPEFADLVKRTSEAK